MISKLTEVLLRCCALCLLLAAMWGCGGQSATLQPTLLTSRTIGAEGGTIADPAGTFEAVFPAGAFASPTAVTLELLGSELGGVSVNGWRATDRPLRLRFDHANLSEDAAISVRMNLAHPKPERGHYVLAVTGVDGSNYTTGHVEELEEEESTASSFSGRISKEQLHGLSHQNGFVFFTATVALSSEPTFTSGVSMWSNGQFVDAPATLDLTGKRVSVVVHGINGTLDKLQPLGAFLADAKQGNAETVYYDVVLGFHYSSTAPLAMVGTAMAEQLKPYIQAAGQVDVFAHSMGNLVSRYAIETTSLEDRLGPFVTHYVSIAGPHAGVPFGKKLYYAALKWEVGNSDNPELMNCLNDLLTQGYPGAPLDGYSFLTDLNTPAQGPDFDRIKYYSMAGTGYASFPDGDSINTQYQKVVTDPLPALNDGVVAVYSAHSQILGSRSASWTAGPTLDLSHTDLYQATAALDQLQAWINSWNHD
jgi:hypothetical protein